MQRWITPVTSRWRLAARRDGLPRRLLATMPSSETGGSTRRSKAGQNLTIAFSGDMEGGKPFRLFDVMAAAAPITLFISAIRCMPTSRNGFSPTLTHYRRKHSRIRATGRCRPFGAVRHQRDLGRPRNRKRRPWRLAAAGSGGAGVSRVLALRDDAANGLYRALFAGARGGSLSSSTRWRSAACRRCPDGPEKTMLGSEQKAWFLDALKRSRASGRLSPPRCRFTAAARTPGANYKTERDEVVDFIKRRRLDGVVMISADYHFARDWSSKRTGIHEFMAGPIATFRTFDKQPETRERHGSKGRISCSAMTSTSACCATTPRAEKKKLTVSYQDSGAQTLFETVLG